MLGKGNVIVQGESERAVGRLVERSGRYWNEFGQDGQILATRVGLRFPARLAFAAWERAGAQLARISDSSIWCLGDWLVYGQEEYADRYQHAIDAAGLDYQTLRNYAWVARRFDWVRRRPKLSFQHHAEVAALPDPDQDRWLDLAERHGWSRNLLRRQIRDSRRNGVGDSEMYALPKVSVETERVDRWRQAAVRAGSAFENWVVAALDQAAVRVLDG
jgi:hypothetical protein